MYEGKKAATTLEKNIDLNETDYLLAITTAVTEHNRIEKRLKGIINGITDVIKVFNPDHTISFFNEAAYKFYSKTPDEVIGKKCYQVLQRQERCTGCILGQVIRTKQALSRESYIPELNKFMDACYNPVMDENGEILFVVGRLQDITEKKVLDKILEDSKERYKQIVNGSPEGMAIIVDNNIVVANNEISKIWGKSKEDVIGSNVYKHFQEKYKKVLHKRFRNIISEKKVRDIHEFEIYLEDGKLIYLQVSYTYILYEGRPAILASMRDISEMKRELNKAAEFQKSTLQKDFPAKELIDIKSVYIPANIISGDFYRIYEVNEKLIIGMVIDVRGKGISAALNISAFDILCFQEVAKNHEPMKIIESLNKKLVQYYEENYIAVCCFSMDFNNNQLKVVGAGINQFIVHKNGGEIEEKIAEGPFLGMFDDSEFCENIIPFKSGDRVFFFTDGLDFILDKDNVIQRYMKGVTIDQFKKYIDDFLNDTILEIGKLKDDSTMIAIEVK